MGYLAEKGILPKECEETAEVHLFFDKQITLSWDEEESDSHVCRLCNKTFYNANALQNHKNLQHKVDVSGSEADKTLPHYTVAIRGPFTCTLPSSIRPDLQCR
ncbi:unnamed protein product [Parnassius apollo]|uniref:(apollo) hypothetical protein n=1 Tax=Parnassius apollo TaxID=110799 RepID=A0A8S3WIF3_PARAO|nr:unnamed protein product [Parnassius apollo]